MNEPEKRSRFPILSILSFKSEHYPLAGTLANSWMRGDTCCAFFGSHVPCARSETHFRTTYRRTPRANGYWSRESTPPPVVAFSGCKSTPKRMRNEAGCSPRPTAHPHGDALPSHLEPRKLRPAPPSSLSHLPQCDPTLPPARSGLGTGSSPGDAVGNFPHE